MSICRTFAACAMGYVFVGVTAAYAQEVVVKFANVGSLSGPAGSIGKENERGAQLAIDELNAKALSIGGKKVKFVLLPTDESADAKQNVEAAKRLVDLQVNGVFGHWNTESIDATAKIFSDAGIPQVSSAAANPKFTQQRYKTAFSVAPEQALVSSLLGKYTVNQLKGKSIAVIDDRTTYGQAQAESFERAVKAAGGKVASRSSADAKATDLSGILNGLKSQNPDVVFFGGVDSTAGPLLRQMKQLGIGAKFVAAGGVCTEDLPSLAGGTFEGGQVICADPNGLDAFSNDLRGFNISYKKKFDTEPKIHATYGYDAVNVMVEAMVRAKSVDPKKYLPELADIKAFAGLTGPVAFDKSGSRSDSKIAIYSYTAGKKLQIDLAGAQMPAFAWPPPAVSSMQVLRREWLATTIVSQGGASVTKRRTVTLGDLDLTLTKALNTAGYATRSYYRVPGGYAVATQLERFGDDGKPASGPSRWVLVEKLLTFNLGSIVRALFDTEPGRFRVIVFVVTSEPFDARRPAPSTQTAMDWLSGGFNVLPQDVAGIAYSTGIACTALIYEFTKAPGGAPSSERPGSLNADQHIRGSGLALALGG